MISSRPEATASSTTYWMVGLSTRGSISFGWALVAGRKRVPRPAAGKTALRTLDTKRLLVSPNSEDKCRRMHEAAQSRHGPFDRRTSNNIGVPHRGLHRIAVDPASGIA